MYSAGIVSLLIVYCSLAAPLGLIVTIDIWYSDLVSSLLVGNNSATLFAAYVYDGITYNSLNFASESALALDIISANSSERRDLARFKYSS